MKHDQSYRALVFLLFALLNLLVSISSAPMGKITTEASKISTPVAELNKFEGMRDVKIVENNPRIETQGTASNHQTPVDFESSKTDDSIGPLLVNHQTSLSKTFTNKNSLIKQPSPGLKLDQLLDCITMSII
ncbi:hypothetical protein BY996DRAFT_7004283 [Phakopsora pachyrhizi]|uniref:Expressed protein n=1 Tax=Phakopsora pachyrhizi TaxID=170000 RepID=A0AAV0BC48_PHAPC|nr:hypothetical protein BY996DRAFT_8056867 [Phakopsora pachyrhizi]KAI8455895.1 hypothetical protein BY996DRAFT_7004283 [Phakopsora pachyrhizi]CAH7683826.1 expressed protein [Phakopsora pachyrhizi]